MSQHCCTRCRSWGMFKGGSAGRWRIILAQTVSMIFISGLWGGHYMCWKGCCPSQLRVWRAVWGGALSCCSTNTGFLRWKMTCADGIRYSCRILVYWKRFRLPMTSTWCPIRPYPMQPQNIRLSLFWIRMGCMQLGTYRSFSWRQTIILPSHLNSVTRNPYLKMTWRQFPWTIQCRTRPAHLRRLALDRKLIKGFRFAMHPLRWLRWSLKDKMTKKY